MSEIHAPWLADLLHMRLTAYELVCHLRKEEELGRYQPPALLLARLEAAIGDVEPGEFAAHLHRLLDAYDAARWGAAGEGEGDHLTDHTCQET